MVHLFMYVKSQNRAPITFLMSFVTIAFVAFSILSSVSTPTYSSVEEKKFWAGLEGEFEVPPTNTNASGGINFRVDMVSIGMAV